MDENNQPRPMLRRDVARGEVVMAMVWLAVGALVSVLIEVVYLGTWLPLPGGGAVPFPYMIVVAALFNAVLTRTALLWPTRLWVAAIPVLTWVAGFFLLMFVVEVSGDMLVANSIRTVLLLFAGIAGGLWPLLRRPAGTAS